MLIDKFDGEYAFLSNFYPSPINYEIDDNTFVIAPTVEHAFQAVKACHVGDEGWVLQAKTPGEAKRRGRAIQLHPKWETYKTQAMLHFLRKKFAIPELREKLLATGSAILIEGNWWHDNYWGSCYCEKCGGHGGNMLGNLLMQVREELKEDELS